MPTTKHVKKNPARPAEPVPAACPTATDAVIYCRVSSERQAKEGDGARSQEVRCRSYVQACGYQMLATFSDDGVSGAALERPGLESLLQFVRSQRQAGSQETVVVIDDISRIARDVSAHFKLRASIKAAGGRLESPSFTFGDSAADELLETIMAATAQYGRTGNREQVLNRMRSRLEAGYWTFPPPIGYRFERHPLHKKIIVPQPEARKSLATALEAFASGRFQTQREVALYLEQSGFFGGDSGAGGRAKRQKVTVLEKRVSRLFDLLPLYAGLLEYPAWKIERRPAHHEGIITPGTLLRIEVRLGKRKPIGVSRADADSRFVLRNFIRCAGCGRPLTGSMAKGKYPRYHCYHQPCPLYGHSYGAEKKVEPAFESLLRSLTPKPEFVELMETSIPRLLAQRAGDKGKRVTRLAREAEAAKDQVSALVHRLARVSDEIAEDLERDIGATKARLKEIEMERENVRLGATNYGEAWERVNTYFRDPAGMWKNGSDKQKKTIHRIVFTAAPVYEANSGFNTYDLTLPYRVSAAFGHQNEGVVDLTEKTWHLSEVLENEKSLLSGWPEAILQWSTWLA